VEEEFEILVDVLDEPTCWRLLARAALGRVGFLDGDDLVVLPVNAAVHHGQVVIRTAVGTSLARAATAGRRVAFEVDHSDRVAESGWSVLVRGRLRDVTDGAERRNVDDRSVRPWMPGPRDVWLVVEPTVVTGRAVHRRRRIPPPFGVASMPID
jgi:nitroimidazol reductase NimA-like FMN-containing flavoprotein (pyridoxamine 5'-phosphate oxidase superfamily)